MTRKDYKLIAKAIAEALDDYSWPMAGDMRKGISAAAYKICDALLLDNPRFDRERFLEAIAAYQQKVKA